jgi:hypothetical protein
MTRTDHKPVSRYACMMQHYTVITSLIAPRPPSARRSCFLDYCWSFASNYGNWCSSGWLRHLVATLQVYNEGLVAEPPAGQLRGDIRPGFQRRSVLRSQSALPGHQPSHFSGFRLACCPLWQREATSPAKPWQPHGWARQGASCDGLQGSFGRVIWSANLAAQASRAPAPGAEGLLANQEHTITT